MSDRIGLSTASLRQVASAAALPAASLGTLGERSVAAASNPVVRLAQAVASGVRAIGSRIASVGTPGPERLGQQAVRSVKQFDVKLDALLGILAKTGEGVAGAGDRLAEASLSLMRTASSTSLAGLPPRELLAERLGQHLARLDSGQLRAISTGFSSRESGPALHGLATAENAELSGVLTGMERAVHGEMMKRATNEASSSLDAKLGSTLKLMHDGDAPAARITGEFDALWGRATMAIEGSSLVSISTTEKTEQITGLVKEALGRLAEPELAVALRGMSTGRLSDLMYHARVPDPGSSRMTAVDHALGNEVAQRTVRLETDMDMALGRLSELSPDHPPPDAHQMVRDLAEVGTALTGLREHTKMHGLSPPPMESGNQQKGVQHLAQLLRPENLPLGDLSDQELGTMLKAVTQLGVKEPHTAIEQDVERRVADGIATVRLRSGSLDTALIADNPHDILRSLASVGEASVMLARTIDATGGKLANDPDRMSSFLADTVQGHVDTLPLQTLRDMARTLNSPELFKASGAMVSSVLDLSEHREISNAMGATNQQIVQLRESVNARLAALNEHQTLPEPGDYGISDMPPRFGEAVRDLYGVSFWADGSVSMHTQAPEAYGQRVIQDIVTASADSGVANQAMLGGEPLGVCQQFVIDLVRHGGEEPNLFLNGKPLLDSKAYDTATTQAGKDEVVREAIGRLRDACGQERLMQVSQRANQSTIGSMQMVLHSPDSFVELPDGRKGGIDFGTDKQRYSIVTDPNGGVAVNVRMLTENGQMLMNADGTQVALDPARSHMWVEVPLAITPRGTELGGPIRCDVALAEAPNP